MDELKMLTELLSYVAKEPHGVADKLISRYGTLQRLSDAPMDEIAALVNSDTVAMCVKLSAALAARRICDLFKFGRSHTKSEIEEYLGARFVGKSIETVYALFFDEKGRVIACDFLGDGIVNGSAILPRRIVELAIKYNAKGLILAHNHPGGSCEPSDEDVKNTKELHALLLTYGIELFSHYTYAERKFGLINISFAEADLSENR